MVRNHQAQAYEATKSVPVTQVELADDSDDESDQDFIEVQQTKSDSSQLRGKLNDSKPDALEMAKREKAKKKALALQGNVSSNSDKRSPAPVPSTSKARQTEWSADDHKSHAVGLLKMAQKRKMKPSKNPAFDFEFDGEDASDGEGPSHVIKIGTKSNSGMEFHFL